MAVSNKTILLYFIVCRRRSMDKNFHCVRPRPGQHGTKDTARPGLPHVCTHIRVEICTRKGCRTNRTAVLIYRKQFSAEYHYYRYRRYCRYGYYYCYYLESASDGRPVKYCMYAVRGPIVTEEMAARRTEFDAIVVLRRLWVTGNAVTRAYTAVGRQRV